ncbi:Transcriptional regulator FurA [compost metagenome]
MIRELKLEGDASRYDGRMEDHHHIVCTECGRVDEVFAHVPEKWLEEVSAETGYQIDQEQVLFKGVCPQCRNSKALKL